MAAEGAFLGSIWGPGYDVWGNRGGHRALLMALVTDPECREMQVFAMSAVYFGD